MKKVAEDELFEIFNSPKFLIVKIQILQNPRFQTNINHPLQQTNYRFTIHFLEKSFHISNFVFLKHAF
jgi:hypothetical protein